MSRKARGTLLLLAGVAVLAVIILPKIVSSNGPAHRSTDPTLVRDAAIPVRCDVIRMERIVDRVNSVGTILPNEEVDIRSEISGKVEKIDFQEGVHVSKGDLLLSINDDELQARLLSARSRQELAVQQEERQRAMFAKQLVSRQEYDAVVSELNVVRAEVQILEVQLAKTTIRAPFDGIVGLRHVSTGSTITPSTPITTIQDNSRVKVEFAFPEKYAGVIRKGAHIDFTVQGQSQTFGGTVYAAAPGIDQATRTSRVRALAANPRGLLIPGAFANVQVNLSDKEGLVVPSYAVIPELKQHKVFVCRNGRAEERVVQVGTRTEDRVEILGGLAPGDSLIVSAILQLRPGMAVRPGGQ